METMNYPASAELLNKGSTGQRRDLGSLHEALAGHVSFACDLGFRAHGVADAIMGSIPTNIANAAARPDGPPPSLADLIDQLGVCLHEISDGLNRV